MELSIPEFEPRLQRRYQQLVKEHLNTNDPLAAGLRALPGANQAFASTQAAWRFYANPTVTLQGLAKPLIESGRALSQSQNLNYGLVIHDWSNLHYSTHTRKPDRIALGKDLGYQLLSSLLVSDQTGLPLAPLALSLWASDGIHTTRAAGVVDDQSHLDELTEQIRHLEKQQLGLPLAHIVDCEADSVTHLRHWDEQSWFFIVRARPIPYVEWQGGRRRLGEIARELEFHTASPVEISAGVIAQQMVAETRVTITRASWRRKRRAAETTPRVREKGKPLNLRLIVVQLWLPDDTCCAQWLVLTNLDSEVRAETIALWYCWRWLIESYFKLCQSAGHHLEQWQQESAEAIAKRLLIGAMACVVVWQVMRDASPEGQQLRALLLRLSGRQIRRQQATAPALLSGIWVLLAMLDVLEHYPLTQLQQMARLMLPGYVFADDG